MSENRVIIYSYRKVWKVKKKIHSFNNIKLPAPVDPMDLVSFGGSALLILLLSNVFPPFAKIPGIIRFLVFPYLSSKILFNLKPDGKNTLKYLGGCIRYALTTAGRYTENFRRHPAKRGTVRLTWNCSQGFYK